MLGWMKHKLHARLLGEISTTLDMQILTTLMVESEQELKSLLMKEKEESGKADLKLSIQKTKIMASSPTTSWQIDGETGAHFIFFWMKITAGGDCSHVIKRCLCFGRDINFTNKGSSSQGYGFSRCHVWM